MSGVQELLFGLIFNGFITAVIVAMAMRLGRKENREASAGTRNWVEEKEAIQRAS
jgi:hypothetical protein